MQELKRLVILLLSGFTGAAAAIGYAVLSFPASQEASRLLPKSEAEWIKNATTMEVCVVFFGMTYFCGGLLALLFRSPGLAAEIKRNGRWHMNILGAVLLIMTLQRFWFTRQGGWRRFDNVFGLACLGAMIGLAIAFKLGLGRMSGTPPEK
ncbi:MAG TPA: hypothetical protein VNM14_05480 [Planctomycetota bacterium]|nr:hypothetical protein [Planctomycetota bacterium]